MSLALGHFNFAPFGNASIGRRKPGSEATRLCAFIWLSCLCLALDNSALLSHSGTPRFPAKTQNTPPLILYIGGSVRTTQGAVVGHHTTPSNRFYPANRPRSDQDIGVTPVVASRKRETLEAKALAPSLLSATPALPIYRIYLPGVFPRPPALVRVVNLSGKRNRHACKHGEKQVTGGKGRGRGLRCLRHAEDVVRDFKDRLAGVESSTGRERDSRGTTRHAGPCAAKAHKGRAYRSRKQTMRSSQRRQFNLTV